VLTGYVENEWTEETSSTCQARYLSSIYILDNSTSLINFLHQFSAQVIVVLTGLIRNEWMEETMYVLHDWWGYGVWIIPGPHQRRVIDDQLVHNPHELIQISFQLKKEKQKESKKALHAVSPNTILINRSRPFMSLRYSTTPWDRKYQRRPKSR